MSSESKIRLAILFGLVMVVIGTSGYSTIEDWGLWDSFYMTIITLSTVGFKEVNELSSGGRIFTIFLIIFGAFNAAFVLTAGVQFVLQGQLEEILGKRKMEKKVHKLKDHIILCGFGRVGGQVAEEFARRGSDFVIIEKGEGMVAEARKRGFYLLEGNAADDDMLKEAGISRAKAIVSTLPDDSDNVYLALTARQLNPDLFIIARAETMLAKKKLRRAGADKVICPHELGGAQMALATLMPNVVDFLQLASVVPGGERLSIEEIAIRDGGELTGKSIIEGAIKRNYDTIVVGLRKLTGEVMFNPSGETVMEDGDILIVLGESNNLERLAKDLA
ncbi:MAG: potassium channel protein [candidate division Zixibacteria bacterium]|nr:potassium channel protein [candidate division Zixibacteria bacterium]